MLEGSNVTLCYHSLNLVVHVVGGANKHRKHLGPRPSTCALSAKQSSPVLRNEGSSNHPESVSLPTGAGLNAPVLSLANTVGVIGGASSSSTLNFLEKLVACGTTHGDESIPFIVCSDPVLNRQLSSHERGLIPSLTSRSAQSQFDPRLVVENLRHKRLFLERSGARCIVMPCHISHSWHTEISEGCSVPFLHVGECVAEELKAANLKPVEAGSNLRIGLLATSATLTAGFYQEKLRNQGFEVVLPDKATMEHTVIPAIEAYDRKDIEGARNLLRIGLQVLLVRAVNTIILASDDMRGLLPQDDLLLKKCIDPMDAMVRSTMQWANSGENLKDKL